MSEFDGGITYAPNVMQPIFDIEQPSVAEAGLKDAVPDQPDVRTAVPELPASHPDVNAENLTIGGLIKACPYYSKLAETDPELARAKAAEVVQRVQAREAMREEGMSDGAIRKRQWSSMRERHRVKIKAAESAAPENITQEAEPEPKSAEPLAMEGQPIATTGTSEAATWVATDEPQPVPPAIIADRNVAKQAEAPPTIPTLRTTQVQLEVERAPAVAATTPYHASNQPTFSPEAATAEVAHVQARRDERPVMISDSGTVAPGHELLYNLETAAEAEAIVALGDALLHDDTPPEKLFFDTSAISEVDITPAETLDLSGVMPDLAYNDMPGQGDIAVVPGQPEARIPAKAPERVTWDDVLEEEPLELYEDFATALQAVIAVPEQTFNFEETTDTAEPVVLIEAIQELEPPPAAAVSVATRLAKLRTEEKGTFTPLLKEIVETVRVVDELTTAETAPDAIEAAQTELEELVVTLFERLGIIHEPEDIEYFVAMMLRPDFQPPRSEELATVNLEHEGTHEAKLHFVQLVSSFSDVEEAANRLLGKLVLLSTARFAPPEYELAAA